MGSGLTKRNLLLQYMQTFGAFVGILISVYALFVEILMDSDPTYKPSCDINEKISCSKALMSRWGKGMGLVEPLFGESHWLNQRNPVYGILLYTIIMILPFSSRVSAATLYLWLVVLSNFVSVYLAYILYFHVKAFCVVCVSMYVINFVLLPLAVWRRRTVIQMGRKKRE